MDSKSLQKLFPWFARFLLLIIIAISMRGFLDPLPPISENATILFADSSLFITPSERYERRKFLSDIVLEHQLSHSNYSLAFSNERMQTRLSFVALMAVLLIPFLSSKISNIREIIIVVIFILSFSIYLYDIHITDSGNRAAYTKILLDNTIIEINNIKQNDSIWYYLSYEKAVEYENDMRKYSSLRKLNSSLQPDLSQIAFYLCPLAILLILYLLLRQRNNLKYLCNRNKRLWLTKKRRKFLREK